jgi:hypothetical protein
MILDILLGGGMRCGKSKGETGARGILKRPLLLSKGDAPIHGQFYPRFLCLFKTRGGSSKKKLKVLQKNNLSEYEDGFWSSEKEVTAHARAMHAGAGVCHPARARSQAARQHRRQGLFFRRRPRQPPAPQAVPPPAGS